MAPCPSVFVAPTHRPAEIVTWTAQYHSRGSPIYGGDAVHWVLTDGHRAANLAELLNSLAWRLVGEGIPLSRATFHVGTLHPQLLGVGARWQRNRDLVEESRVPHAAMAAPIYLDSPIRPAVERGESVRHRLDREDIARFPLLVELAAAGITDYLALPLASIGGRYPVITFATDRAGGFGDADVGTIARVLPALAVVVDFTAIGPAVNLVCRLESLTKRLDRPLLMSRDIAAIAGRPVQSLGFHPVRGLSEPEEVFGLA